MRRNIIETVLIVIAFLTFVALLPAQAQTNDQYAAYINPANGVYYAFVEAPVEALQTVVPVGAPYSEVVITPAEYDEDGNETVAPVIRQKTIVEYAGFIRYSLDGTKAVVGLTAKQGEYGRINGVNAWDIATWDQFLTPYGFGSAAGQWMTLEQMQARMASADYTPVAEGEAQ